MPLSPDVALRLLRIERSLQAIHERINMNHAELAAALTSHANALAATGKAVDKITTETAGLLDKIAALQVQIGTLGVVPAEVTAALAAVVDQANALQAKVAAADQLVPDA